MKIQNMVSYMDSNGVRLSKVYGKLPLFCSLEEAFMQDFWSPLQKIIRDVCSNFDKVWQIRKRVIDTNLLVLFIFKLVLSKNHQGYKSLLTELWENSELASWVFRQSSKLRVKSPRFTRLSGHPKFGDRD